MVRTKPTRDPQHHSATILSVKTYTGLINQIAARVAPCITQPTPSDVILCKIIRLITEQSGSSRAASSIDPKTTACMFLFLHFHKISPAQDRPDQRALVSSPKQPPSMRNKKKTTWRKRPRFCQGFCYQYFDFISYSTYVMVFIHGATALNDRLTDRREVGSCATK